MVSTQELLDDAALRAAAERYRTYTVAPLSYGTVRDFCDSADHLAPLAALNGDLKDQQRPWMLKAVLGAARGRRGRLLEIGAGEPVVADLLRRLGHEVWIVDPYDGTARGPTEYESFRARYPKLRFVREEFGDTTPGLKPGYFDCIYSISVMEHIPGVARPGVVAGLKRFLQPEGVSIHAIDFVHRGNSAEWHLAALRTLTAALGSTGEDLTRTLAALSDDTDTYYLSAESHNRWRNGVPYDEFPMRVLVSIQICCAARSITAWGEGDDH